ncbi:hypothetical protein MOKP58_22740 [Mycobacterium avium subsp. hominissuis]
MHVTTFGVVLHLGVEVAHGFDEVVVAGLTKLLLGAEVVPQQPGRHPCRRGDAADGRPFVSLFAELAQRRVPDAGAGGEIVGICRGHCVRLHDWTINYTAV